MSEKTEAAEVKMFDLSKNNPLELAEAGYEFNVELPDGTRTDWKIKVRGGMSKVVRDFQRRVFEEIQYKEKMQARKPNREQEPESLDELEDRAVKNAVTRIIGWSGLAQDGKEVKFTKEVASSLLKEHFWLRQQVLDNSDDMTNFRLE